MGEILAVPKKRVGCSSDKRSDLGSEVCFVMEKKSRMKSVCFEIKS